MKKNMQILIGALGIALASVGCAPIVYAQADTAAYPVDNGYNYDNGYNETAPPTPDQNVPDYGSDYDPSYQGQSAPPASGDPSITYNDFYTQLSPYGQWADDPTYGRVWMPNVSGFQPYSTNGYWSYTNYGWTWMSNYPWGWAPFHYGRWGYSGNRWFWVPGYSWGPAWVAWSSGSDMYGWAPLSPGLHLGVSFSIGSIAANLWTFMPSRYMGERSINNYYAPRTQNVTIIKNTTIINNYGTVNGKRRYTMGPSAADVEKITGRPVQRNRVVSARDPKSAFAARDNAAPANNGNRNNNNGFQRNNNASTNSGVQQKGNAPQQNNQNVQRANVPQQNNQNQNVQRNANTNTAVKPNTQQQNNVQRSANTTPERQQNTQQNAQRTNAPLQQQRNNVQMYRPQVRSNSAPSRGSFQRAAPATRSEKK